VLQRVATLVRVTVRCSVPSDQLTFPKVSVVPHSTLTTTIELTFWECPGVPVNLWRGGNSSREHTATHCNTLQHTATHCNTLQHIAVNPRAGHKYLTATHCITLQHTATHCSDPVVTAEIATYMPDIDSAPAPPPAVVRVCCSVLWFVAAGLAADFFSPAPAPPALAFVYMHIYIYTYIHIYIYMYMRIH